MWEEPARIRSKSRVQKIGARNRWWKWHRALFTDSREERFVGSTKLGWVMVLDVWIHNSVQANSALNDLCDAVIVVQHMSWIAFMKVRVVVCWENFSWENVCSEAWCCWWMPRLYTYFFFTWWPAMSHLHRDDCANLVTSFSIAIK